ncbi:MAG: hypothetical protein V4662_24560 [Verrucomicrobiota bacterium]
MSWSCPKPRWETVAGRALDSFFLAVRETLPDFEGQLTVFGSAPIQLCLDEEFISADADVMVLTHADELRGIASRMPQGRTGLIHGVQICPAGWFQTTPHYLARAHVETRHGLRIVVPHLRDVLIGKLHRSRFEGQDGLVAKDLRAVHQVRKLCGGHPDEAELLEDLRLCEPFFRPPTAGEVNHFKLNVLDLWRQFFGRTLDVQKEIIDQAASVMFRPSSSGGLQGQLDLLRPERD